MSTDTVRIAVASIAGMSVVVLGSIAITQTIRADNLARKLRHTKIDAKVAHRWLSAAMRTMTPDQIFQMTDYATTDAKFEDIITHQ